MNDKPVNIVDNRFIGTEVKKLTGVFGFKKHLKSKVFIFILFL
jgi:hypothetical protein